MAILDMQGFYNLTSSAIDSNITKSLSNYALGYVKDSTFFAKYNGRSDIDVNSRLKDHLFEKYSKFKFSYANSPKAALKKNVITIMILVAVRNGIINSS